MLRIHQLKMPVKHTRDEISKATAQYLGVDIKNIVRLEIFKRSIDARKVNDLHYVYAVDVELNTKPRIKRRPNEVSEVEKFVYRLPSDGSEQLSTRPVVIGFGPAGLFASYLLALAGRKPLIFERGKSVEERSQDIEKFLNENVLDPESNVLFGEGGAGTFSDGKLNTLIKDKDGKGRFVLETFVKFGADESILYDAKPHIGTDRLVEILKNMRREIIRLGGEIHFESRFCGFTCENKDNGYVSSLKSIKIASRGLEIVIPAELVILATGHSARDVFKLLNDSSVKLVPKAFSIGVRAIHPQKLINENQYGSFADILPAAPYKLTAGLPNGRSVYSFCMCPGGFVINSSSEPEGIVVNGMSNSGRDGKYANAAIIVNVTPEDFEAEGCGNSPLSGIEFQRKYERLAYKCGKGSIPVETLGHFRQSLGKKAEVSELTTANDYSEMIKGRTEYASLKECLPAYVSESLAEAFDIFDRKIAGFGSNDTLLAGIESRTSSPVRITRDEKLFSNIYGLIPCGEGAGYAGGIMSAALDGIKAAEMIIGRYGR